MEIKNFSDTVKSYNKMRKAMGLDNMSLDGILTLLNREIEECSESVKNWLFLNALKHEDFALQLGLYNLVDNADRWDTL